MLDLQDRFINYLWNGFYHELKQDLQNYADKLADAIDNEDHKNTELYFKMLNDTRELLSDLSDENMTPRDFMDLILEKYAPKEP